MYNEQPLMCFANPARGTMPNVVVELIGTDYS